MERGMEKRNSTVKPRLPSSTASTSLQPKSASPSSSICSVGKRNPSTSSKDGNDKGGVSGRVRAAVRLRPKSSQEMVTDVDFADCVELQPEMKRVKLRKNNWDCDTYPFDEVLVESSSQKRVYEAVAKPVVESVCEGYNGTIMAYGQSGTGKTYTLGNLGEEDTAERGIMVRALEDILENVTSLEGTVTVSYLQIYMESVQDLLSPKKNKIGITEDSKTGDISVPDATQIELKDRKGFLELLKVGEANRLAANTQLNTESSRSHSILLVNVKKVVKHKIENREVVDLNENGPTLCVEEGMRAGSLLNSKLLIVDLAGSERIGKSGSLGHKLEEAKFINLSLTALGKCINALARNSPHVPIRDSKLTRMLSDSFGGTARTSLIVTIGPSPRHRGETASTLDFGQRAMKVENILKLREEVDYRNLCQKFEMELDRLQAENERLCKARQDLSDDSERKLLQTKKDALSVEDRFSAALKTKEVEDRRLRKEHGDMIENLKKAKEELKEITELYEHEIKEKNTYKNNWKLQKDLTDSAIKHQKELTEQTQMLQQEITEARARLVEEQVNKKNLERELSDTELLLQKEKQMQQHEITKAKARLAEVQVNKEKLERELRDINLLLQKEKQMHQQEIAEAKATLLEEQVKMEQLETELGATEHLLQKEYLGKCHQAQELKMELEKETQLREKLELQVRSLKLQLSEFPLETKANCDEEIMILIGKLEQGFKHREILEEEIMKLKHEVILLSDGREKAKKITAKVASERSS